MSHIFILIHIMSFVTGISLICLLSLFRLKENRCSCEDCKTLHHDFIRRIFLPNADSEIQSKNKSTTINLLLIADILYTISQAFETLLLYLRKNVDQPPMLLNKISSYLMVLTLLMAIYFVKKALDSLNQNKLNQLYKDKLNTLAPLLIKAIKSKKSNIIFVLIILASVILPSIYEPVFYIGITLITLMVTTYIILDFKIFSAKVQKLLTIAIIASVGVLIFSCMINFIDTLPNAIYKIPTMPILYFCLNTIGIIIVMPKLLENTKSSVKTENCQNKDMSSYNLTQREQEIIPLIIEGKSNAQIAEELFISVNTVKNHVYNLYKKLGIKTRYELLSMMQQDSNFISNTKQ